MYTINISTEHLKYEQVALMLSGMGSAGTDVFRMVRITHTLLGYLNVQRFSSNFLTTFVYILGGVDEPALV